MRILIIEDEAKTANFIRKGLVENGFTAKAASSGAEGFTLAVSGEYDLIILDVMLPEMDGWEIIKRLRDREIQTPVIFLTARDAVQDRVRGLELGANDYLIKPFAFSELLARIRNIRRQGAGAKRPDVFRLEDLEVDFMGRTVRRMGKRIDLTPKEFSLFALLIQKQGEVLSRTRIAERIWNMDYGSDTNIVDVHIRRLRSKIDDPFERKYIHTVRGSGYYFE